MRPAEARKLAKRVSAVLAARFATIEATLLFGSVSRGQSGPKSDIDLLVLGADPNLLPTNLSSVLPRQLRVSRLSLIYYPLEVFLTRYREGWLFMHHLHREATVLFDRSGVVRKLLASEPPAEGWMKQLASELDRVRLHRDIGRFNGHFLLCLADLYTAAKGVVMVGLARQGIFEFDRDEVFQRFARNHPEVQGATLQLLDLKPFSELARGRSPSHVPFPYRGNEEGVRGALQALEKVAEAAAR